MEQPGLKDTSVRILFFEGYVRTQTYSILARVNKNTLQLQHISLIKTVAKVVKFPESFHNSCTEPGRSFYHFAIAPPLCASTRYVSDRSR